MAKTDQFAIETYNVDQIKQYAGEDSVGRIMAQIGYHRGKRRFYGYGLRETRYGRKKRAVKQPKGIYFYQELTSNTPKLINQEIKGLRKRSTDGYFNKPYYLRNNYKAQGGGMCLALQYSWTGPKPKMQPGNSYNGIVWTPQFKYVGTIEPAYFKKDKNNKNVRTRIGCRSTPWVLLWDEEEDIEYAVISIHGNVPKIGNLRAQKNYKLMKQLSLQAQYLQDKGYYPIMAGDLNMKKRAVDVLTDEIGPDLHSLALCPGTITHLNVNEMFFGRLDWIIADADVEAVYEQIDDLFTRKEMMEEKGYTLPSDHALVRAIVRTNI